MEEILDILECQDDESEDNIQSIIVLPPNDGIITDVDSDDEDDRNLNHLTPAQLKAEAEIAYRGESEANVTKPVTKKKKVRHWKKSEAFSKEVSESFEDGNIFEDLSIVETWESIFTNEILSLLVDMSNKYAMQRNHFLNVTHNEMKVYIEILLLTGYLCPKSIRMFWEI